MSSIQQMDELVKEYLLYRGFTGTIRILDSELKLDKDKAFRPDKIVEQFVNYITVFDLNGLKEYWSHFDHLIFEKLDHNFASAVKKIEHSLLRMYLVNAIINSKQDKVLEFFEKMGPELQNQQEWKDWFALPFVKNPEENPIYMVYFTRQWQDTLLVSLHNLLAMSFQCLPQPRLTAYNEEASRISKLQAENDHLKMALSRVNGEEGQETNTFNPISVENLPPGLDMVDEFYLIPGETSPADTQSRSFRSFIRGFGGSGASAINTSPLSGRRGSNSPMNR
uniref:EOG090X0719 n=1 Tax=Moina brachiata TaxID=675436 RepID=A0A4Y7NII7_9CRUS|nr:EOG090X0719 [Moina brachiata]